MTDEAFRNKLNEAMQKIAELPEDRRAPLVAMIEETRQRHGELKQSFARISSAMDEWRLLIKYLIFDREATHREVADLRRRLDERDS